MLCCAVYHADTMVDTYPLPSVADLLMLLPLLCGPSTLERFPLLYLLSFAIKLPEPSTNSSIVVGAAAKEEIKEEFSGFNGDEPEDGPYLQILEAGKAREVAGLSPRPTRPEDVVLPKIMYVSMQSKGECTHIFARKSIYPVMTCYNI